MTPAAVEPVDEDDAGDVPGGEMATEDAVTAAETEEAAAAAGTQQVIADQQ